MKYLRVTMPDGSRWDVPAQIIAEHRATTFNSRDTVDWKREVDYALNDQFELKDWAANNMNWRDVQSVAKKAEMLLPPPVDYQEGWMNGDKVILEY